jgi:hypothetical protein
LDDLTQNNFTFVIPGREQRQLRASPESIAPGGDGIDHSTNTHHCGVWIPGLRCSRLRRLQRIPE